MPEVSHFHGIKIYMIYEDHGIPHFHVKYAEFESHYAVETLELLVGYLPNRQRKLVEAWAELHHQELKVNMVRVQQGLKPHRIRGLR